MLEIKAKSLGKQKKSLLFKFILIEFMKFPTSGIEYEF